MFGENLKTLRKNKGITQEELAARLNIVRQTISKWEKGESVPDAEMLVKLADIFEVPVSCWDPGSHRMHSRMPWRNSLPGSMSSL